ncbi:siderophore-interacting protein [Corynebacterium humireducens NBRC 106098 = DSM 45392]|uniref:Siderophore-interacting protein n=1 Tax=Corynebacterium humireducens NBRC 106098 = DSM 45392 TaxID=1223515 RepID=A0A0B5D286_9CORY|nr:siderophore-interacting protein [Corynebacterium humireducens]AJE32975.1 siderophore-interacting protein [Corynebacterium humireducens NBRC 106098 = DSM 45392]
MNRPAPARRPLRSATVTGVERLTPELIRLSFHSPDLVGVEVEHTDHYIKIVFGEMVTRTYTFRRIDPATGCFDVDFVTHGDRGLAGPWAQRARVGDTITFRGPGGAWHPEEGYGHFVFAGDESAAPAIAAGVEKLPAGATADVYLEIADAGATFDMPQPEGVTLHWVTRDGATHGTALSGAVRAAGVPEARTGWFIHGVAEMIRELRRWLLVDRQVDRGDVSISGYWRLGMTEDQWQASKRDFNAALEADLERAGVGS